MLNDVAICSTALLLLGADEITSFNDETRESKLCNAIYELTVRTCLADRNWAFAQNAIQLNKLVSVPLIQTYSTAFQLPKDFIRLVGKDNVGLPHVIKENYLYCNADEIKVYYVFRPTEDKFPAYFTQYLIDCLCKKLAIALMEDESKAEYYDKQAFISRKKAGLIESQSNGNTEMPVHQFAIYAIRS